MTAIVTKDSPPLRKTIPAMFVTINYSWNWKTLEISAVCLGIQLFSKKKFAWITHLTLRFHSNYRKRRLENKRNPGHNWLFRSGCQWNVAKFNGTRSHTQWICWTNYTMYLSHLLRNAWGEFADWYFQFPYNSKFFDIIANRLTLFR